MVVAALATMASPVLAAEFPALSKRAVKLEIIRQTDQKAEKQAGRQEDKQIAKAQLAWKWTMTVPKTQTSSYAVSELAALTTYVNAAAGTDLADATMRKDMKGGEYLLEVILKSPPSSATGMLIAPDIQGLLCIEWVGTCPTNSDFVAKFEPGEKPSEEQQVQLMEVARFMATVNHGINPKTHATHSKRTIKGSDLMIEIGFPESAFGIAQPYSSEPKSLTKAF